MIVPTLRYRDAKAMIDWLCLAFGFERKMVVEGNGNQIAHAQLAYGSGMVMISSLPEGEEARDHDGRRSVYVVVDDPDAHCSRAKTEGAVIVDPVTEQDYGGRHYSAKDPEGYSWHFGSYDPLAPDHGRIDYEENDELGIIEIRVAGRVTAERFEEIIERMEAFLKRHDSVRIVEIIDSFEGMDLSLLFDDFLFSMRHMRRFSHVAIVTDIGWVERMSNAAAVILPAKLRLFPLDSADEARNWIKRAT